MGAEVVAMRCIAVAAGMVSMVAKVSFRWGTEISMFLTQFIFP